MTAPSAPEERVIADTERELGPGHGRHVRSCNHALCPCYLAGLRAGVKPTGKPYFAALTEAAEQIDGPIAGGEDV